MADFKQARVPRTRGRALVTKATAKPMSRTQTSRTPAEQKEHEASYKRVHAQRTYALAVAAKAALAAHIEAVAQPLVPNGRGGQFTTYQLLAFEFAEQMETLLPASVMAKGPVSINSSCVQRFTARLTEDRRAHKDLIFTVETQQLVEVEDGHDGKMAWRIQKCAPAAARARALIDGAAQSDESGHSSADEMDTY